MIYSSTYQEGIVLPGGFFCLRPAPEINGGWHKQKSSPDKSDELLISFEFYAAVSDLSVHLPASDQCIQIDGIGTLSRL
jgi:hypothetical protein